MTFDIICRSRGHLLAHPENRPEQDCDQVLGRFHFEGTCPKCGWSGTVEHSPLPYSTDISAAFQVVEKMRGRGFTFKLRQWMGGAWTATFFQALDGYVASEKTCNEASEAICVTAISALSPLPGKDLEKT